MDVVTEILDLKRRVGDLEGAFNVLTGHLRQMHPDLTQLKLEATAGFETLSTLVGQVDERIGTLDQRISGVDLQVWSLRDDLPALIGEAIQVGLRNARPGPQA